MNLSIAINVGSATPIYRQITEQVRLGVARGRLKVGEQLPSVRGMAEELVINPNTVARAYTDLAREGLIESRAGRGVYVTEKRQMFTREEGWRRLEPLMEGLIGEAMVMDFTREELKEAFAKKLRECRWKHAKGEKDNHE